MNIDLRSFIFLWVVLSAAFNVLRAYHQGNVPCAHDSLLPSQTGGNLQSRKLSHRLEPLDKWGQVLTAFRFFAGPNLGTAFQYQSWVRVST